jgi:hypothetical protein
MWCVSPDIKNAKPTVYPRPRKKEGEKGRRRGTSEVSKSKNSIGKKTFQKLNNVDLGSLEDKFFIDSQLRSMVFETHHMVQVDQEAQSRAKGLVIRRFQVC